MWVDPHDDAPTPIIHSAMRAAGGSSIMVRLYAGRMMPNDIAAAASGNMRMEAEEAMSVLLDRFPPGRLRLDPHCTVEHMPLPYMLGPVRLFVRVGRAGEVLSGSIGS